MKTFDQLREGFVSAAQRKAVWASKADGGKGHPDNKKEDSDAVKAFLAKGGKIKKLPPAKAQGYHGKDDPGKGMHGMLDKPDTKKIGTRKKVKSMEATQVDEISKDTKKSYIKKAADDMSKQADRMARAQRGPAGDATLKKAANKFVNRRKGIARAVENFQVQKYTNGKKDGPAKSFGGNLKKATAHASKMGGDHRVHKEGLGDMIRTGVKTAANSVASAINNRRSTFGTSGGAKSASQMRGEEVGNKKPPFDNAKKISTTPTKDQFGNVIKNRAKSLARAAAKKAGGDMGDKQKKESVNELDQKTMNSYHAKAQKSKDKATNSAVATILRKGDHSKDLQTRNKRVKGMALAKTRTLKSIRGDK